jgi:hypothetical protein
MTTPRLLDQVRAAIRVRHYSRRIKNAYAHWVRRFISFSVVRHPGHGRALYGLSASSGMDAGMCRHDGRVASSGLARIWMGRIAQAPRKINHWQRGYGPLRAILPLLYSRRGRGRLPDFTPRAPMAFQIRT